MFLRTEIIKEKKLIGKHTRMSFANNTTFDLWRSLMPRRKEITNNINSELISLEVFDDVSFFSAFNPNTEFNKWACIEVKDYNIVKGGRWDSEPYYLQTGACQFYPVDASNSFVGFRYVVFIGVKK